MKAMQGSTLEMLHRIEGTEKEIVGLKLSILKNISPSGKKNVSLKGILKGIEVTDLDSAKY
ncbi:MAG: hypothetical protein EPN22_12850 [Nitrospirae bacterium]|nr:MAG: hypothetical protein EPN22_12850 [Nitrospirota bacterium]